MRQFKKKKMSLERAVLKTLEQVKDPDRRKNIIKLGMVSDVQISAAGDVVFAIEVDPQRGPALEPLRQEAEAAVAAVPGVKSVTAVLTAQATSKKSQPQSAGSDPHGMNKNPKLDLPIKKIIAIASGKGGVGKSTISANLAVALAGCMVDDDGQIFTVSRDETPDNSSATKHLSQTHAGEVGDEEKVSAEMAGLRPLRVGLLDADIYGPSQPRMMGLSKAGQPTPKPDQIDAQIIPLDAYGVKVMSIGFMVDQEAALVWRGPMVQTAIYQLLRDVKWGTAEEPLDILIVDMPPGTGDAQLTMAQKVPLAGAIIVSTPQDIALMDARKGVEMFRKTGVKILGLIENMSTHICTNCGHEEHIFGHGGAKAEAEKLGVPFLGEIPLSIDIREKSDAGEPGLQSFEEVAQSVISALM